MAKELESGNRLERLRHRVGAQVAILTATLFSAWMVEIVDTIVLRQSLNGFGIRPRQVAGLWGILFMPILHGDLFHLLANTLPFIILGWLVMLRRVSDFVTVTLFTTLFTGVGLWLFGSSQAIYIGGSSLVFGYFGFLLLRGYFERSPFSILVALAVLVFYGSMIWGVLPQQPGIAWEAHLLGFIGGVLSARLLSQRSRWRSST